MPDIPPEPNVPTSKDAPRLRDNQDFLYALQRSLEKMPEGNKLVRFFEELAKQDKSYVNNHTGHPDTKQTAGAAAEFYQRRIEAIAKSPLEDPSAPTLEEVTAFQETATKEERIAMQKILGNHMDRRMFMRLALGAAGAAAGAGMIADGARRNTNGMNNLRKDAPPEKQETAATEMGLGGYEMTAGLMLGAISTLQIYCQTHNIKNALANNLKPTEATKLAATLVEESDAALQKALKTHAAIGRSNGSPAAGR